MSLSIITNVSNRHIHLSADDLKALFGANATLTVKADLLQPEAFAAEETVTIVGPKGSIERVRIVGPLRPDTQCEILAADRYKLGIDAPVRLSGHISGSSAFTISGPHGTIEKSEGLIVAKHHIHLSTTTATAHNLQNGQTVSVVIPGERAGILQDVILRVSPDSIDECHIDTEEGNALGVTNGARLTIQI